MSNIRTPNIPGFIPQTRAPQTRFPKGATDCHAHVFGPQERFPYLPGAAYIPPDAVTVDYVGMLKNNGCDRGAASPWWKPTSLIANWKTCIPPACAACASTLPRKPRD
jgi:hypothetical protein